MKKDICWLPRLFILNIAISKLQNDFLKSILLVKNFACVLIMCLFNKIFKFHIVYN